MIAVTVAAARATPAKAAIAVQSVRLSPRNDSGESYGLRSSAARQQRGRGVLEAVIIATGTAELLQVAGTGKLGELKAFYESLSAGGPPQ